MRTDFGTVHLHSILGSFVALRAGPGLPTAQEHVGNDSVELHNYLHWQGLQGGYAQMLFDLQDVTSCLFAGNWQMMCENGIMPFVQGTDLALIDGIRAWTFLVTAPCSFNPGGGGRLYRSKQLCHGKSDTELQRVRIWQDNTGYTFPAWMRKSTSVRLWWCQHYISSIYGFLFSHLFVRHLPTYLQASPAGCWKHCDGFPAASLWEDINVGFSFLRAWSESKWIEVNEVCEA